ncbi:DUF4397 domain-containing protein [Runella sp. SP2]|uniref:DUF4397 domain-containing protein n=1 Tax=Runella sp. SP2 TaxID=2268026 RepID=UPI000F07FDE4|nr:DUF4397 domain-containing protein [Runella sp. SP2]AYQ32236.1 DUF4397 domain-containing protein [Runella sp. SP2]
MKKFQSIIKSILLAGALSAGLFACIGESSDQLTIVTPAAGARVKFHHMVSDGPGVSILVNDRQFSGVLTVAPASPGVITYGNIYPAVDYATIDAGSAKVEVVVPASGSNQQVSLLTGTVPLEANKYYSVFAVGSAATATLEPLVVEDKLTPADTSKAYIRVVNTIVNATTGYDVGYNGTYAPAMTNVGYKKASDFVAITPVATGGAALPVQVRLNGTTTNLAPATFTLSPIKGRFYTIILRGRVGGTGTQALTIGAITNR